MSFFDYFRSSNKQTANVAKERLQVIVAHQRSTLGQPSYLPTMRHEILEVIRKYVQVNDDAVKVEVEREGDTEILELNVVLPDRED